MMPAEAARCRPTLGAGYFRRLYAADPDPWGFATSAYERAKYAATLAALPRQRYRAGFEIGCSIGVLTRKLAARCERLLAVDLLAEVVARARARCAGLPQVAFERMAVPDRLPGERLDLIVLSEVGYYLGSTDLDRLSDFIAAALWPRGHLLMVHWTGATDYPLSGDQVHERVMAHAAGTLQRHSGRRAQELPVGRAGALRHRAKLTGPGAGQAARKDSISSIARAIGTRQRASIGPSGASRSCRPATSIAAGPAAAQARNVAAMPPSARPARRPEVQTRTRGLCRTRPPAARTRRTQARSSLLGKGGRPPIRR